MAAALLLATGSGALDSSEFIVAAGSPVTVALKDAKAGAAVRIQLKDDAGAFQNVGEITFGGRAGEPQYNTASAIIDGPGTYRLQRQAGSTCGAFSG